MKKILLLLTILAFIAALFILFFNKPGKTLTNQEKDQALTKILGRKANIGDSNEPTGNTQFKGKYVSFFYPARAKIYTTTLNGQVVKSTDLESLIFDLKDPKMSFFMEVLPMPITVSSVADYPGVKLRQAESGMYKQAEIAADNLKGLSFERIDIQGSEKTAFFYSKDKVYSFSFQGPDINDVRDLFKEVTATIKFL